MKEKPIRKMNREELLEMLIRYSEEKEALERRVAQLEEKLMLAKQRLDDRSVSMERVGSIAEASLQLSGVFEAAQKAADLYLENIRRRYPDLQANNTPQKTAAVADAVRAARAAEQIRENPAEPQMLTRRRNRGTDL